MTKLFDKAIEAARALPADVQDEIAHAILSLTQSGESPESVPDAHLPALLRGLDSADKGDFASDEEVEAALRRFRE